MRLTLRQLRSAASATALVAAAVAYAWFHRAAALTLPVPWPDELHFMLPARAWLEHGSLMTAELHPERPIMWMPPGHAFLLAEVFRWTGVSLVAARGVSFVFALVAAVCFWDFSRRSAPQIVATLATVLLMLHPAWVVTGNVARMDAMTIALVCGGFVVLRGGWPYAGGSILCASALVHPNGAVFAASGAIALWIGRRQGRCPARPPGPQLLIVSMVAAALVAYAIYALVHVDGFIEDMGFQFRRKADAMKWSSLIPGRATPMLWAAYALAVLASLRRYRSSVAWLAALGLPAWWVARVGREMWYQPYDVLFLGCFVVAAVAVLLDVGRRLRARFGVIAYMVPVAGVIVFGASFAAERPRWPSQIRWRRMTAAANPYLDDGAVDIVAARLAEAIPRQAVEFFPRGDAIFFLDVPGLRIVDPVRFEHAARWRVLHESPHHPPHWRKRVSSLLEKTEEERLLLHERTQTDRWWLVPIAEVGGES